MTSPDYVAETLNFLDTNWNTNNYSPKPTLYDGRDSRQYPSGPRDVDHDLTDNAAITVGGDTIDKEPEGLSWDFDRVDAGLTVRVEAAHQEEFGTVADAAEFKTLRDEALRALEVERKRPLPDYYHLLVDQIDTRSANYGDYFRADLAVAYVGLEKLP